MPTPPWKAARNGLPSDRTAANQSAQINQLLGSHSSTEIYAGQPLTNIGNTYAAGYGAGTSDPTNYWALSLGTSDWDQPFPMAGTTLGRVLVPLLPVGNGADLQVSLCADNAGVPGAVITSTRVPAAWVAATAGVTAISTGNNTFQMQLSTSPLALPQHNLLRTGAWVSTNWKPGTINNSGASLPRVAQAGGYVIGVGGAPPGGGTPVANVFTAAYLGTTLGAPVAQPALPQPTTAATIIATADTVVCAGGMTSTTAYTAAVYTASWDSVNGKVGAWSTQASLPAAVAFSGGAVSGSTVYVVAGQNSSSVNSAAVYYATVQNGQLQSWTTAAPLPGAVYNPGVAVVGNFLVVAGGATDPGSVSSPNTTPACYYAAINSDGSLRAWQQGPRMFPPLFSSGEQTLSTASGPSGMVLYGGSGLDTLSVGATGPGAWTNLTHQVPQGPNVMFPAGYGQWQQFALLSDHYQSQPVYMVPHVSVPLPTTGLTNNGTYHLVLRQQGGDANNYLRTIGDANAMTGVNDVLYTARGGSSWTASGNYVVIPFMPYDLSTVGQVMHTWEDSGARISTLFYTTTPDVRLLGIAEATSMPGGPLNSNPDFEAGLTPWAVTGGTVAQSTVQKHGGVYSAQLTPSGTATQCYLGSEQVPVAPGAVVRATAWAWFTAAVTTAFSASVNWFDSTHKYLTTSTVNISATAGTWTQASNVFTAPPNAAYMQAVPTLAGTPAATQVWYLDDASLTLVNPDMLADVAAINYPSSGAPWPPLGVTTL